MEALKDKPTFIPTSYTIMDDLFIPDPIYPYKILLESYRFTPVSIKQNHSEKDKYELSTYIYIKPFVSSKSKLLDEVAALWQNRVNRESNSLIQIKKKGYIRIAETNAYELIYNCIGYDDKRDKNSIFVERVYFIPVSHNQVASIRLVRDIRNDNQITEFWSDWMKFLKSVKIETPSIQSATTEGKSVNTRHYHVRNMTFDIPLGDKNNINLWYNDEQADRNDSWQTEAGIVRINYSISNGYDDSKETQNNEFKQEAEAWGNKGVAYLASMALDSSAEFEYHELPFGKNDTIYGVTTIDNNETTMKFNVSYKDGKSIEIEFKADDTTMAANKEFILKWLGQFSVIK